MVCGNKNRIHNIQTKQSPFGKGQNIYMFKESGGRRSIIIPADTFEVPGVCSGDIIQSNPHTALLGNDCYHRLYLMQEDTETLHFT